LLYFYFPIILPQELVLIKNLQYSFILKAQYDLNCVERAIKL